MRKYNSTGRGKRQMTSQFTLQQLAIIDHLAAQPRTASLEQQAGAIINRAHGSQPLDEGLRAILASASNGKATKTEVMEVTE